MANTKYTCRKCDKSLTLPSTDEIQPEEFVCQMCTTPKSPGLAFLQFAYDTLAEHGDERTQ